MRWILGIAAAALASLGTVARPDLVVSRVWIEPEAPGPLSVVAVAATVENVGTEALRVPFDVRFRDDAREISRSVIGAGFRAGEAREILAAWIAEPGDHTLTVSVDEPGNVVRESDEDNNAGALAVTVPEEDAPTVAVLEFDDNARAHLDNVGCGVSEKLAARLEAEGVRVLARGEIETWMRESGLDPASPQDLAQAARALGSDYVVRGSVDEVVIDAQNLELGLVSVSAANARVALSAQIVAADGKGTEVTSAGRGEGATRLSVSLPALFAAPSCDVCGGGFASERPAYGEGELISLGYRGDATPRWLGVEIYGSDGSFLRWLGWRFAEREACETWVWNQRDGLGVSVGPGFYVARLRDAATILGEVTLQVRPSLIWTLPSLEQLTVGTAAFDDDAVGVAMADAVDQLAAAILPFVLSERGDPELILAAVGPLLGQVASTAPDGGVTINVGAADGVAVGDRFEVVSVEHLTYDPDSLDILSYDVIASRGEIQVTEVRERAATGTCVGACEPSVGDMVRRIP